MADAERNPSEDIALVCGASEDGQTLGVLRKRGERVEPALLRKAVEGQPIHGELVRLTAREDPMVFDVETLYAPPPARGLGAEGLGAEGSPVGHGAGESSANATTGAHPELPASARSGPAKVTTPAYRRGWSRLFSTRKREPSAPS